VLDESGREAPGSSWRRRGVRNGGVMASNSVGFSESCSKLVYCARECKLGRYMYYKFVVMIILDNL
jgi:hypothetical protein